jgi:hypothetical protein
MSNARNLSKFKPSSSGLVETADIADDAITTAKVDPAQTDITSVGTLSGLTTSGAVDVQGNELILDADNDTSITADTDDQIDIKIGGTDTAIVTADTVKIRSDNGALVFRRTTSETDIAKIQYVHGNPSLDIGGDGKNVRFINGSSYAETMRVGTNGNITIQDGDLVIGTSGHGIDFSAETGDGPSVTSELLDSYEEGHIGTISMNSAGSNTIDSANSNKYYIKVGRVVHCYFHIVLNGTLSAGSHALEGLPFTSSSSNPAHRGAGVANAQDASSSYGQDGNYTSITTSENVTSATLYNPVQYVANDRLNVYLSYVTAS